LIEEGWLYIYINTIAWRSEGRCKSSKQDSADFPENVARDRRPATRIQHLKKGSYVRAVWFISTDGIFYPGFCEPSCLSNQAAGSAREHTGLIAV
jgi:hypothetical protein